MAMLEAQPDVCILVSKTRSYGDMVQLDSGAAPVRFGHFLKEIFANVLLRDRWHVIVDADEFLILPPPLRMISQYVDVLESSGLSYGFSPMVDFYPRKLKDRNYDFDVTPFEGSPYSDSGAYHRLDSESRHIQVLNGGVRGRILKSLHRIGLDKIRGAGLRIEDMRLPTNYKFPLLKASHDLRRVGSHWVSKVSSLCKPSCIAHFKFYPELDAKLASALSEGQYHRGSIEYKFLSVALSLFEDVDLTFERSKKYTHPDDLVSASVLEPLD